MTVPDWIVPPVNTQIQMVCEGLQTILGEELVGIYLHGSLAMKCFNLQRSDLDLLVVNRQQMSVDSKYQTIDLLLRMSNAPVPIEISFLILSDIHPFVHPLPFDLHYSETWRKQKSREMTDGTWRHWNDEKRRDSDLAAHVMIARHRGITLYGKPISEVLPLVPNDAYALSILGDYHDARDGRNENPVYFILNACRVHAFLTQGKIFSKAEGGMYGLAALPDQFHPLISQGLKIYQGTQPATPFEEKMLDSFANFMNQKLPVLD